MKAATEVAGVVLRATFTSDDGEPILPALEWVQGRFEAAGLTVAAVRGPGIDGAFIVELEA